MSIMVENMKDAINFEQKLTTGTTWMKWNLSTSWQNALNDLEFTLYVVYLCMHIVVKRCNSWGMKNSRSKE
jgi:hypothetical protein